MTTSKRRPTSRTRASSGSKRKSSKTKHGILRIVLLLLVVLLSLGAIALAASYVYIRMGEKKIIKTEQNNNMLSEEYISTDTSINEPKVEKSIEKKVLNPTELEGTWVSTSDGTMLTINNAKFTIDFPSVEVSKPMSGNIQISKRQFTIENTGEKAVCAGEKGNYSFEFINEDLIVKSNKDNCGKRAKALTAKWFKL